MAASHRQLQRINDDGYLAGRTEAGGRMSFCECYEPLIVPAPPSTPIESTCRHAPELQLVAPSHYVREPVQRVNHVLQEVAPRHFDR
jgi:hypothetical protein